MGKQVNPLSDFPSLSMFTRLLLLSSVVYAEVISVASPPMSEMNTMSEINVYILSKWITGVSSKCLSVLISPFLYIFSVLWHVFVKIPFTYFMHVIEVVYPVLLFCLAAIVCGVVIGGFAGFAAEAMSALLISATWGTHSPKKEVMVEEEESEDDADGIDEDDTSSFNTHSESSRNEEHKKNETEPMRAEKWHDLFSPAGDTPVLIHRMRMTSDAGQRRRDAGWDWDEDDD
ncbi:hypothetical protein BDB01DRAFT_832353 [Pilobolus umbonatus]|nr:hypothetical protein BDB01DRAFT_832353 [Pilobolus umbonatus]